MTIRIDDSHLALVLQDEIRRSEEARYDHRLHAVLLVAKGMSCLKTAELLGDSERTVRYWIDRYLHEGLQGLIEDERTGRPSRLTDEQIDRIGTVLRATPKDIGLYGGIWDGKTLSAFIQQEFNVDLGVRQCQRLFRQLGFRLRKPRPMIARSDPAIQMEFKKKSDDF
ncbi:MAG TPA: transposase [Nitrospiraceae bacterium]|nr:transposase [Nitrospiraceae bacterium]